MNTNLSAMIAAERHERLINEASEYRRSASLKTPPWHRFAALIKGSRGGNAVTGHLVRQQVRPTNQRTGSREAEIAEPTPTT